MMKFNKEQVLEAISEEWMNQFGRLDESDQERKDKYYFMTGFVRSALENAETNKPRQNAINREKS